MSATHDHPIRGRFHAWFLSATEDALERLHGKRKRALLADLPPALVELGPGTGANFRHYPQGTHVVAIEPNRRMHARLREAAARRGVELDLRGLRGERLDLEDACTDAVVCTLVLCSVTDPQAVLREALRVLRPGGRFVFIEHVAAPDGSALRRFQSLLRPAWSWCFEGCRPDRDTEARLAEAGFGELSIERFRVPGPFVHVSPHIAGVAHKPRDTQP